MSCAKQLRALVSQNGNKFHEIVKNRLLNSFKAVSKGINSGPYMFSLRESYPIQPNHHKLLSTMFTVFLMIIFVLT